MASPFISASNAANYWSSEADVSSFVEPHKRVILDRLEIARRSRFNAAQTSREEERKWLTERQTLLQKQMTSELTTAERKRLEYARWNLAKIEDARIGPVLDELEAAVKRYEEFSAEISRLRQDFDAFKSGKRR